MVDIVQNLRRLWDDLEGHLAPFLRYWSERYCSQDIWVFYEGGGVLNVPNKYIWLGITGELLRGSIQSLSPGSSAQSQYKLPIVISITSSSDEDWRKALSFMDSLSNLCEFLDDEWNFVALQKDLRRTLCKRLHIVQQSLILHSNILQTFTSNERHNPHIGYRRPSAERLETVYNRLVETVRRLGSVVYDCIEDDFRAIEAKLTGTETI
jgi:hypothetical protein